MYATDELERLQLLFRRGQCLPSLPTTAMRLIETIDQGDASAAALERVISADPRLTAAFLKAASAFDNSSEHSIRMLVLRMGHYAVRNVALCLIVKGTIAKTPPAGSFSPERYSRHSVATGILARYIFARQSRLGQPVDTHWTADELFAMGVLHDLSFALLAQVAPDCYERVHWTALRRKISLAQAFKAVYGKPHGDLGAIAAERWELPELFADSMRYMSCPWSYREQASALCCLAYADELASEMELGLETWQITRAEDMADEDLVLPVEERAVLKDLVLQHVDSYVAA